MTDEYKISNVNGLEVIPFAQWLTDARSTNANYVYIRDNEGSLWQVNSAEIDSDGDLIVNLEG